jgi:choline transport protein
MPSSGGGSSSFLQIPAHSIFSRESHADLHVVYHWASVTAGKHGRICGWFAGWWNFLAWILAIAATAQIVGAQTVSMYALSTIEAVGAFFVIAGFFISVLVCAIMPHIKSLGYASNDFVWREWQNDTGYSSDGFVFCLGMLNGAFAVGTPDVITHLAEEIPK